MSKRYSCFAKAYKKGIIIGFRTIDDVRPESLRKDVEELLAMDGLGPDGKPKEDENISEVKEEAPKENESEEESPNKKKSPKESTDEGKSNEEVETESEEAN